MIRSIARSFFLLCGLLLPVIPAAAIEPGDRAPGFILSDTAGRKVSLNTVLAGGKPAVISFFATWCKPCLKEIPHLENFRRTHDVNVYLVNIDQLEPGKVAQFARDHKITLPVLLDPDARMTGEPYGYARGGVANIPALVLISERGIVSYVSRGYDPEIEKALDRELVSLAKASAETPKGLTIFFTNSSNGYLESCDCPTNPYGGLVRRASYLARERERFPNNLLLDTGDLFPPYVSDLLAGCLLDVYAYLGYDAVAVGDQEISSNSFETLLGKTRVPFLASNLHTCRDDVCTNLAPGTITFERGGVKIAVLSVIDPDVFALYPETVTDRVSITPLDDTVAGFIKSHRKSHDLLILLSHCGIDADRHIAQAHPGLDVIVGGHSQTLVADPVKVGGVIIVQAGENAQNIGRLTLEFGPDRKVSSSSYEMIPLTKDIPDDPRVRALITEYKDKLKTK